MVQSIGYDPAPPCECVPISSPGAVILPATEVGTKFEHSIKVTGTTIKIVASPYKPSWLSITTTTSGIKFSGTPPDTTKVQGVVQLKNECSSNVIVQYSGQARAKCAKNPDIVRDLYSANTFVQELITVPSDATIQEPQVLPSGMAASVFDNGLNISGTPSPSTVFPFEYTIDMVSECGNFKVTGTITTAAKAADCVLPAVTGYSGTPVFEEGVPNEYCMSYTGTKVRIDELPELPVGLVWDQITPGKICVKGTLVKDVCNKDAAAACVSLLLRLENDCGALKTYMSLQSVNTDATATPFCAGLVTLVEEVPPGGGLARWAVTARYFPIGSVLTVALIGLNASGFATIVLGDTKEITITAETTTDTFDAQTTGSGCATAFIQVSHPTCAVMTNVARATPLFQIYNNCSGGGV